MSYESVSRPRVRSEPGIPTSRRAVIEDLHIDVDTAIALLRGTARPGGLNEPLGAAATELDDVLARLDDTTNTEVHDSVAAIRHYLWELARVASLMAGQRWAVEAAAEGWWGDREQSLGLLMQNGLTLEEALKAADQMDAPADRNT